MTQNSQTMAVLKRLAKTCEFSRITDYFRIMLTLSNDREFFPQFVDPISMPNLLQQIRQSVADKNGDKLGLMLLKVLS